MSELKVIKGGKVSDNIFGIEVIADSNGYWNFQALKFASPLTIDTLGIATVKVLQQAGEKNVVWDSNKKEIFYIHEVNK